MKETTGTQAATQQVNGNEGNTSIINNLREEIRAGKSEASRLDPHEVFNASIEFQQNLTPPTRRRTKSTRSSNSSLYPSVASLTDLETPLDVERNWDAARRSSTQRRPTNSEPFSTPMAALPVAHVPLAVTPAVAQLSSIPVAARAASIPPRTNIIDDDDAQLRAMKLAAYGGGNYVASPAVVAMQGTTGSIEDEALDMKVPAHDGLRGHHTEATLDTPAHAVVVDDNGRTADVATTAVQAEFLSPISGTNALQPTTATIPAIAIAEATDTAVVEGGSMRHTDAAAWCATPAAEATLLQEGDLHSNAIDLDSKPPARGGLDQGWSETMSTDEGMDHQAEVTAVEYDLHPSELVTGAVHAEFVGQDYQSTIESQNTDQGPLISAEGSQVESDATNTAYEMNGDSVQDEHVTEVAVIESGPMDKATAEAWSAAPDREAQVLEEVSSPATTFESKAPPSGTAEGWETEAGGDGSYVMADGEAEVVGITEESHPSEFTDNAQAQAELIGSDFNTAIAVPSPGPGHNTTGSVDTAMHAEVILEDGAQVDLTPYQIDNRDGPSTANTQEAHATLLDESHYPEFSSQQNDVAPVTAAVLEHSSPSGRAVSEPTPITPVAVLEETPISTPSALSFSDPVKPQPFSGRAVTAPVSSTEPVAQPGTVSSSPQVNAIQTDTAPVATATQVIDPRETVPPIPSPSAIAPSSAGNRLSRPGTNAKPSNAECAVPGFQSLSSNLARGANNVMETLFGNAKPGTRRHQALAGFDLDKMSGSVLPRTLLPSSVIYSEATNSWVATVNTNQKALEANNVEESSKALRAFSVPTKKQAMALASAWAPPQMHPFSSNPVCFICESQFAVFRRASHCRNCGVCVCGSCSVQWPSKMLPATYNIKRESTVSICKACDWLCSAFRLALLQGDRDKAFALYSTGNINLTTPFANVKGELFYPVHCAVLGGDLGLLKWLVDEHSCPLRSIRISNGKQKNSAGSYTPILTSKGRSLLGIALGNRNIGIVRYLVVEKRMLLSAEKGLSVEVLAQNLDLVLRVLPEEVLGEQVLQNIGRHSIGGGSVRSSSVGFTESTSGHPESDIDIATIGAAGLDGDAEGLAENECIICFDKSINCVFTPCGHQICCMDCGNHISRCPVCAVDCTPMRVFKP